VLQLPLLDELDPPGLAFFDLGGGTRLLFEGPGASSVLYLATGDSVGERARLEAAGVAVEGDVHRIHTHTGTMAPAGTEEWMTFFRDSEGNLLGLSELRQPS
jgi:methylmalonyl-CoA/ethylmalonyl-CoA epimerase